MRYLATSLALACLVATAAHAEDKASLTKQGAKLLSGQELASLVVGKTSKGESFNEKGERVATWTSQYSKDGRKIVSVGGKRYDRKWWMDGGNFCETLVRDGSTSCKPSTYKLGSSCYGFHGNGMVKDKFRC